MQEGSILALSPSFNSYSSTRFAEIAVKVSEEFVDQKDELGLEAVVDVDGDGDNSSQDPPPQDQISEDGPQEQQLEEEEINNDNEDEDDDFEFSVVCKDPDSSPISADEIFSNGQIRPIYPVFNRNLIFADSHDEDINRPNASIIRLPLGKLLIEERDPPSSSSSDADELEQIPAGTYCVWTPKPVQASSEMICKKSNSTGSSKRWRFRDFLHRSNSDGKDTFVFLAPSNTTKSKKIVENVEKAEVSKEKRNSGETKVIGRTKTKGTTGEVKASAHEIHYVRNRALKEGDRRRSYLPYRQDLVGLFSNGNGLGRNLHHPF